MATSSHQPALELVDLATAAAAGEIVLPDATAAVQEVVLLPEAAAAAATGEATLPEADAGQAALPEDLQLDEGRQIVDAGVTQSEMDVAGDNVHTGNRCTWLCLTTPMSASYVYTGIFLLAIFVAWQFRENPITYFGEQRRHGCQGDRACLAAEGVLITSFCCFLFYTVMFFSTVGTRTLQDRRNKWHSQCWLLKAFLCILCGGSSVLIPYELVQFYGKAAHFGAVVFLLLQLRGVVRLIAWLNYKWCQTNFENHYRKVITVSVLAYSASIVGIVLMFYWYGDYWMNKMFIGITLGLVILMFLISCLSMSPGSCMEAGLMGAYMVFLCWSTILSEPDTGSGDKTWKIIALIAESVGITYSTWSTGADDLRFSNVVETENYVPPYGYGLFHLVFATGCMYFGMLFVSWDIHQTSKRWSMDVGRISMWTHFSNQILAFIAFVAVFIARRFEIGWLRQLLGKIFGIDFQQQQNNNDAHQTQAPEGSAPDIVVPPEGSRATDVERSETDNGPPPPDSHGTELERSEMGNNGPPPSSSSTLAGLLRIPQSPSSSLAVDDSDGTVPFK